MELDGASSTVARHSGEACLPEQVPELFLPGLVFGGSAFAFLHLPVELDGALSTAAQHSEEVRLPGWASGLHLPDLSFSLLAGAILLVGGYHSLAGVIGFGLVGAASVAGMLSS